MSDEIENGQKATPDEMLSDEQREKMQESSVIQQWETIKNQEESDEKEGIRNEYLVYLEDMYQKFTSQYGQVQVGNVKDYLIATSHFAEFSSKLDKDSQSIIMDDMGRRFLIDAVINADQIVSGEEKERFVKYFMDNLPYSDQSKGISLFFKMNLEIPAQFIRNYPKPQNLKNTLKHLYKRSFALYCIRSLYALFQLFVEVHDSDIADLNDRATARVYDSWLKSLPREFKNLQLKTEKADGYIINIGNPDLTSDFLNIIKMLYSNEGLDFGDVEKLKREAIDELFTEAETQFGKQFQPPNTEQQKGRFQKFFRRKN